MCYLHVISNLKLGSYVMMFSYLRTRIDKKYVISGKTLTLIQGVSIRDPFVQKTFF